MQIVETGSFDAHRKLTDRIPESLVELTTIPGVGAKTALRLYSELGVDSLAALEAALVSGRVRAAKGLGARAEAAMLAGIEAVQRRSGRTPLGVALPAARAFMAAFSALRPDDVLSLAGSARRWDITVGDLDFVVGSSDFRAAGTAISNAGNGDRRPDGPASSRCALRSRADKLQISTCRSLRPGVRRCFALLGTPLHLERLGAIPDQAATEEEVYASHGLPFIPPELRSGHEEFERLRRNPVPGDIERTSTASFMPIRRGVTALPQCDKWRMPQLRLVATTLLGITDHSQGLAVAGGLDVERLRLQRIEIDEANGETGVRVLAGRGGRGSPRRLARFRRRDTCGPRRGGRLASLGVAATARRIDVTADTRPEEPERGHHCPPFGPADRASGRWRLRLGSRLCRRRADRHRLGNQRRSRASRFRPSPRLPCQPGWLPDHRQLRCPSPIRFFAHGIRRGNGQTSLVEARSDPELLVPGPDPEWLSSRGRPV